MATILDAVATTARLRTAGISADHAITLRRRGELIPLWRGVDLSPGQPPATRLLAATLLAPDAVLSAASAARALGYDVPAEWPDEITVDHPIRHRDGLRVVCRAVPPDQRTVVGGLPVTSLARTVADVLCRPWADTLWLLDQAIARGLRPDAVAACLEVGQRGGRRAQRLLPLGRADAESPLESRVRLILAGARLPEPALQHRVVQDGRIVARLDLAWPDQRIALEADGIAWHGDPRALHVDRLRQNRLSLLGWVVLRATWADTCDADTLPPLVGTALGVRPAASRRDRR